MMGTLAWFIAFLIGASIIGFVLVCIYYAELFIYLLVSALFVLLSLIIGIPIAELLGVHP